MHPEGSLAESVRRACAESRHLLNVLHVLQRQFNHVPAEAIREVASQLKLPVSQVEAVVEFYSFFDSSPRGRFDIRFSNCTSCGYLSGEGNPMQQLCVLLGVVANSTRADGKVSISETSCIGMCDHGASLLVNGMPVTALDSARVFRIAELVESETPLANWPTEWLSGEQTVRREGLLLRECLSPGAGLHATLARGAEKTLQEIIQSGLRGRGGAGFSTGMKWRFCKEEKSDTRFVVCNADEGEPGTFKDRMLIQRCADSLIEGMSVCARVIGATRGFIYLRGEYRHLLPHLRDVLASRRNSGLLGTGIVGQTGFDFDIEIVLGAGSYVCGEESALIESLEGKRGVPRLRPPFPVTHGYLGKPTVVNNVETFVAASLIALHGCEWMRSSGTTESIGSKLFSISGDCDAPGIYEYPFGITLRKMLADCGAQKVQAVQVGGPSGTLVGPAEFDRRLSFEDLSSGGSIMIFGQNRDLLSIIGNFSHFFAHESCGFCTPCRVGTSLLSRLMNKVSAGRGTQLDLDEILRLGLLVKRRSHCGLGQSAANPILDGLKRFPQAFEDRLASTDFEPYFDLDAALGEARQMSKRTDSATHLR